MSDTNISNVSSSDLEAEIAKLNAAATTLTEAEKKKLEEDEALLKQIAKDSSDAQSQYNKDKAAADKAKANLPTGEYPPGWDPSKHTDAENLEEKTDWAVTKYKALEAYIKAEKKVLVDKIKLASGLTGALAVLADIGFIFDNKTGLGADGLDVANDLSQIENTIMGIYNGQSGKALDKMDAGKLKEFAQLLKYLDKFAKGASDKDSPYYGMMDATTASELKSSIEDFCSNYDSENPNGNANILGDGNLNLGALALAFKNQGLGNSGITDPTQRAEQQQLDKKELNQLQSNQSILDSVQSAKSTQANALAKTESMVQSVETNVIKSLASLYKYTTQQQRAN